MEGAILIHWGNKGQKWGTRNYRNYDGTLTEAGRQRYDYYDNKTDRVYRTARLKQMGPKTYDSTGRWGELQENLSKYTNNELRALTERANLEKAYREAFNTKQYTKGKKLLNSFKQTMREIGDIAQAGKKLIDGINGIKEGINNAKNLDKKIAEQEARKAEKAARNAEKEANKIISKKNDEAAKDWLLSITNYKQRDNAMDFLKKFSGRKGNNYGNISSDQLERIKKLYEKNKP